MLVDYSFRMVRSRSGVNPHEEEGTSMPRGNPEPVTMEDINRILK